MQVISGKFRAKKLLWVSDSTTRPTTARVKENIFNTLSSVRGRTDFSGDRVLCLFSGSGQMGIECLSRGSAEVTFNDRDPRAAEIIKQNCASIGYKPTLYTLDYLDCLKKLCGRQFDIVFLDPPFADTAAPAVCARYLLENKMLSSTAIIVAETETPALIFDGFNVKTKKYGRAVIYFITPK